AGEGRTRRARAGVELQDLPGLQGVAERRRAREEGEPRDLHRPDARVDAAEQQRGELRRVQLDGPVAVPELGRERPVGAPLPRARVLPREVAVLVPEAPPGLLVVGLVDHLLGGGEWAVLELPHAHHGPRADADDRARRGEVDDVDRLDRQEDDVARVALEATDEHGHLRSSPGSLTRRHSGESTGPPSRASPFIASRNPGSGGGGRGPPRTRRGRIARTLRPRRAARSYRPGRAGPGRSSSRTPAPSAGAGASSPRRRCSAPPSPRSARPPRSSSGRGSGSPRAPRSAGAPTRPPPAWCAAAPAC